MRALFVPSYLGGGFGHIARCLALAEAWAQAGHYAEFALNGPHLQRVRQAGFTAHALTAMRQPVPGSHKPAFVFISGVAFQFVRDGFDSSRVVERAVREGIAVCRVSRPDVLIADHWLVARLVARACNLPLVQIVKSFSHPRGFPLIWWKSLPPELVEPDVRPIINPMLRRYKLAEIERAEELGLGDLMLVPSIPEIDPLPVHAAHTHHVGALIRATRTENIPGWMANLDPNRPVIYVSVGGAAGSAGGADFFRVVAAAFETSHFQVVISTGGSLPIDTIGHIPDNILVEKWVPGAAMLDRSDLAVFHGGYTWVEVLKRGLPSVVIPFHSEQESYGRRLEAAGAAMVVPYSSAGWQSRRVRWAGQDISYLYRSQADLSPSTLRQAVERALDDPAYRRAARVLQKRLDEAGGAVRAVQLIEETVRPFAGNNVSAPALHSWRRFWQGLWHPDLRSSG
jgi:UDP:flavonoid glycosyltransferase YjiC (YdhE family)